MNNAQKSQELKQARTYGIMGIILEFAGVPVFLIFKELGFIISIAGLILLLLAIKSISTYYSNQKPVRYMLYSLVSGAILAVASTGLLVLVYVPGVSSATGANSISVINTSFLTLLLLVLFLFLVPGIVSIIFQYIAYNRVGKLIGSDEFHTASLFLLTGSISTITSIAIFVFYSDIPNNAMLLDIVRIIIFIGIVPILPGIVRLIVAFAKLPGEAKPSENNQNPNQSTYNEMS